MTKINEINRKHKNQPIDNFKLYEEYKNSYIIESYYRIKNIDTVVFNNTDENIILEYMDINGLWEDHYIYWINDKGEAIAPIF